YAHMYETNPSVFKWAGMAAFASCKVGTYMQLAIGMQLGRMRPRALRSVLLGALNWISPVDCKQLENALRAGNDDVYWDLYWQHLAYHGCGIEDIEKAYKDGKITKSVLEAWRKIDQGKKGDDQNLVWEGNEMLLKYEQQQVLQIAIYDTNPALWKSV